MGKVPFASPLNSQAVLANTDPWWQRYPALSPGPMVRNGQVSEAQRPPPWLITTAVHDAHYYLVRRSAARAHAKIFKVLYLSLRLEIHPEIENTSHQICRLNISRPFDASRGIDKNFVFSFTGAVLWGESAQELAADQQVCTCTERGATLCKEDCLEHMFKVYPLPARDIFGSLRRRRRASSLHTSSW